MRAWRWSKFGILMAWAATVLGLSHVSQPPSAAFAWGALLLAMPAVATLPALSRFLLRDLIPVWTFMAVCAVALAGACVLWWRGNATGLDIVTTATPLFQTCVVAGAYQSFLRVMKREPIDVAFNSSDGLFWDRALAILAFLVSYLVPVCLIVSLTRGWS